MERIPIKYKWQVQALEDAKRLGIELTPQYERRWFKLFKDAEKNKTVNLSKAYSYVKDHPDLQSNESKILMFFKIARSKK